MADKGANTTTEMSGPFEINFGLVEANFESLSEFAAFLQDNLTTHAEMLDYMMPDMIDSKDGTEGLKEALRLEQLNSIAVNTAMLSVVTGMFMTEVEAGKVTSLRAVEGKKDGADDQ